MGGMIGGGGGGGGGAPMPTYGSGNGGVGYTAPSTPSPYQSSYQPTTATPALQSVLGQQIGQPNSLGLPSLQSMFNLPQRAAPQAGGIQQLATMKPYVGSTYRPDMSAINANLNNVAPSVALQQQRAAEEAARQAALEALNPRNSTPYDMYGGGG
jgi:hypothetical protein